MGGWNVQHLEMAMKLYSLILRISVDLENPATFNKEDMVFALSHFICETRKIGGEEFPPSTLCYILITVQMHLESLGYSWKLIDGPEF